MKGAPVSLPTDAQARKNIPIVRGCLDYFPNALAAVAELSRIGNEQHNPGEEMHWSWGKSSDHADCVVRHIMDRGTVDTDNVRHSAKAAWRALANLEEELVKAGATPGRAVKFPDTQPEPPVDYQPEGYGPPEVLFGTHAMRAHTDYPRREVCVNCGVSRRAAEHFGWLECHVIPVELPDLGPLPPARAA